ncbi:MAG: GntR family transcriptional regulator, partial [Solirubrobacteraceae bacterium]
LPGPARAIQSIMASSRPDPKVEIDRASPVALHQQVAAAIRRAIADGEALPGERLPPARDLAGVLGVNTNTVLRSLHTLRDEGLVQFRRGLGVTVTGAAPERNQLIERVHQLVDLGRKLGYPPDELAEIVRTTPASGSG